MSLSLLRVNSGDMSREDWLAFRRTGIGGSDAAAILGLNPYFSPFDVYADKLGLRPDQDDNEAMRQGRDFEDYVARRFMEQENKKVRRVNAILTSEKNFFMIGNVDRLVVGEDAGLECKTTSVLNKEKFNMGEYPPNYYAQSVHYMAVTGAQKWYIAVLVLNKGFHVFEIQRDENEIAALVEAERQFWENHVLKEIPPSPDGMDSTTETIKAMFPRAHEFETTALYGEESVIQNYLDLDSQISVLEKRRDAFKQSLQLSMGAAEIGKARGFEVQWKNQTRQTLDTKRLQSEIPAIYKEYLKPPQTVRVFKIKGEN
jgi:putative phage-type endonuclease